MSARVVELRLIQDQRLSRAVNYLVVYILGCQPELFRHFAMPRTGHGPILDPTEPDNVGYYGWPRAMSLLNQLWSDYLDDWPPNQFQALLLLAVQRAVELAWYAMETNGLKLPLVCPRAILDWQAALAGYFTLPGHREPMSKY